MYAFSNRFGFTAVSFAALICAATPVWSQTKIDFAFPYPESSAWTVTLKWWISEVDKSTQGRVKFVPHYAGALVTANETFKAVRDGAVPAGTTTAAAITGQMPGVAYLEAIGGLQVEAAPFTAAQTALRPVLEEQFRKQGLEYLWSVSPGGTIVLCRDRHMKAPADWKNRKVRTAGRWQAEQLRAMGGSPVATDASEQYIALQNRTIDCALSVSSLATALKLYEVAPKVTLLRMSVNFVIYVINKSVYEKISAGDRATMRRLGIEAEKRSADELEQVEIKSQALMKSNKADIYALSNPQRTELRKAIGPAFGKMDGEGGTVGKQIGDVLKRFW